ncbi:MAG: hypothetical protein LJE95_04060 [Acidobacteria bacterium]|nr:hypothetical protein [Acidobacteriota bacterium]
MVRLRLSVSQDGRLTGGSDGSHAIIPGQNVAESRQLLTNGDLGDEPHQEPATVVHDLERPLMACCRRSWAETAINGPVRVPEASPRAPLRPAVSAPGFDMRP